MEMMKEFPKVTAELGLEDCLKIVRQYIESINALLQFTPGGPFESGGIVWDILQPDNFCCSFFGHSLLVGLFGESSIQVTKVTVVASHSVPGITIFARGGYHAILELRNDVLEYVVTDGDRNVIASGELKEGVLHWRA